MSIDLDWSKLDAHIARAVQTALNDKLQEAPLPAFIRNLRVLDLAIGETPPEIELLDVTDPLPLFYEDDTDDDDDDDSGSGSGDEETDITSGSANGLSGDEHSQDLVQDYEYVSAFHNEHAVVEDEDEDDFPQPSRSRRASSANRRSQSGTTPRGLAGTPSNSAARRPTFTPGTSPQHHQHARGSLASRALLRSGVVTAAGTPTRTTHASVHTSGLSSEDFETASAISPNPPPYAEHAGSSAATGDIISRQLPGWQNFNVPFFHSALYSPDGSAPGQGSGYVSASGLTTPHPFFHPSIQHQQNQFMSRRDRRRSSSAQYLRGDPRLLRARRRQSSSTQRAPFQPPPILPIDDPVPEQRGPGDRDVQLKVRVRYDGRLKLSVALDLALNHPAPGFVSLPLRLDVTSITLDFTAVVAYIGGEDGTAVHFAIMDEDDPDYGGLDSANPTPRTGLSREASAISDDVDDGASTSTGPSRPRATSTAAASAEPEEQDRSAAEALRHPIRALKVETFIGGEAGGAKLMADNDDILLKLRGSHGSERVPNTR
ncbi:Mitochondrial distribution and morphology protein 12 [Savitreella phatthalungensis]